MGGALQIRPAVPAARSGGLSPPLPAHRSHARARRRRLGLQHLPAVRRSLQPGPPAPAEQDTPPPALASGLQVLVKEYVHSAQPVAWNELAVMQQLSPMPTGDKWQAASREPAADAPPIIPL